MDNDAPELDALLDQILPGSAPAADASDPAPAETPASVEASDPSVAAPQTPAEATPPPAAVDPVPAAPDPDLAARLSALETQLTDAQQKAGQWDQLRALAEQRQREAAEQQQREAWQQRIDALVEMTPEQAAMERSRLIAEIEQTQRSRYEPQVAERESAAEEAAKAFAAFYTTAQHTLTPEQFVQLTEQSKFLLQFNSPDAMTAQVAREKAVRDAAYAQAKAELTAQQEQTLAQQAQARIASPADLVGAGATGSPASATGGDPLDQMLDQIFPRR